MFVALDGIDGAGKSTQLRFLCDWLQSLGLDVVTFRDPGSTKLGEAVRELLLHREDIRLDLTAEMFLYMAARAQLVDEYIRPAIELGKFVVADRYLLANVVYQGCAGGLNPETLWQIGNVATRDVRPAATIVIDVPVEVAFQRIQGKPDRLEKRDWSFFERVRQGFLEQIAHASPTYLVVDGTQPAEVVFDHIQKFLVQNFEEPIVLR